MGRLVERSAGDLSFGGDFCGLAERSAGFCRLVGIFAVWWSGVISGDFGAGRSGGRAACRPAAEPSAKIGGNHGATPNSENSQQTTKTSTERRQTAKISNKRQITSTERRQTTHLCSDNLFGLFRAVQAPLIIIQFHAINFRSYFR